MTRTIFLAAFSLASPAAVLAQCHHRVAACVPVKHVAQVVKTEVITPVAPVVPVVTVPVVVPAFSFQYTPPPQLAISTQLAYGGAGQLASQSQNRYPVSQSQPAAPPAEQPMTAVYEGEGAASQQAQAPQIDTSYVEVLRRECATCHTFPGKGKVDLFTSNGSFSPSVPPGQIYRAMDDGRMPPNKATHELDRRTVRDWVLSVSK